MHGVVHDGGARNATCPCVARRIDDRMDQVADRGTRAELRTELACRGTEGRQAEAGARGAQEPASGERRLAVGA